MEAKAGKVGKSMPFRCQVGKLLGTSSQNAAKAYSQAVRLEKKQRPKAIKLPENAFENQVGRFLANQDPNYFQNMSWQVSQVGNPLGHLNLEHCPWTPSKRRVWEGLGNPRL